MIILYLIGKLYGAMFKFVQENRTQVLKSLLRMNDHGAGYDARPF